MKIAEPLKGLRDFIRRRVDDDDDGNCPRPPGTPLTPPYDLPLYKIPLPSPSMSDDKIERTPTAREKVAISEKVKC